MDIELGCRARLPATKGAVYLGTVRPIGQARRRIASQLAADRGRRPAQRAGHGPHAATSLQHARNRHPFLGLQLLILPSFFHVHTLRYPVLHFRFEAAACFSVMRRMVLSPRTMP